MALFYIRLITNFSTYYLACMLPGWL